MPILITNTSFEDVWGNIRPFNQSNAGDKLVMKTTMRSSIVLISAVNPMIFSPINNEITSGGIPFGTEGFRTGDTVSCLITDQNGTPVLLWSTYLEYVINNGSTIKVNTLAGIPDVTLQHQFRIQVTGRNRQSIECFLNHIDNSVPSNDNSLIDGEATRYKFSSIDTMTISSTQSAEIVGNQSGQYLKSAELKRIANINANEFQYELRTTFVNSGLIDPEWFESATCLKASLRMLWSSLEDEPFSQTEIVYNDAANTGYFDQAHNSSSINASLVQGVSEIDFVVNTPFVIKVDGPLTELGIGSSYMSVNDSYFKNKPLEQGRYGMIIPTEPLSITTYNSEVNPNGAAYQLRVDDIQVTGSVTNIEVVFIPNPQFSLFMDSTEDLDKQFFLWVKCGNLNLLAFKGQLTKQPPVGGELIMEESKAFFDHSDNTNDGSGLDFYTEFDTEDDLAYFGTFLMDKSGVYQAFRVRIEAFNTVNEQDFTLKETVFSFASTQIDGNGVYLIDENVSVNPQLPTTSNKRNAIFKRDASIDTLAQFGVSIYYPVVLDWQYWIQQLNASVDFYPNQNKDWQNYSGFGDWVVRMELELIKDGLAFTHSDVITIFDYNNDLTIIGSVQLIREVDSTVVGGFIDGEIMRIKVNRTSLSGAWSSRTWGNIRIYPKESNPPFISSTVIDYDNNSNNPLFPIPGETGAKLTILGSVAYLECLCDVNKLSGPIQTITYKIKDPNEPEIVNKTTAPDDISKTMSPDDEPKTLA